MTSCKKNFSERNEFESESREKRCEPFSSRNSCCERGYVNDFDMETEKGGRAEDDSSERGFHPFWKKRMRIP
jgi:hypothetical protein